MSTITTSINEKYMDSLIVYGFAAMMTAAQCKAARALLGWSQEDLSNRSLMGVAALRNFERGKTIPMRNNLLALKTALEEGGIEFLMRTAAAKAFGTEAQEGRERARTNLKNPTSTDHGSRHKAIAPACALRERPTPSPKRPNHQSSPATSPYLTSGFPRDRFQQPHSLHSSAEPDARDGEAADRQSHALRRQPLAPCP